MSHQYISRVYSDDSGVDYIELNDGTCLTITKDAINLCVNCRDLQLEEGAELVGHMERPQGRRKPQYI